MKRLSLTTCVFGLVLVTTQCLANNATAAAIANAVADAAGCRLFELPITAERVYAALKSGRKSQTG